MVQSKLERNCNFGDGVGVGEEGGKEHEVRQLGQMFRMEGKEAGKAPRVFSLRTAYLQYRAVCSGPGRPASWITANRWGLEGLQTTLGTLQLMADAVEAGSHLCSGAHATHLACLHLFNPPITFAIPQGLQIKFLKKADIRPKEGECCLSVHVLTRKAVCAGF